ncbi:hypothetical protein ACFX13_047521 [Malus domestica]
MTKFLGSCSTLYIRTPFSCKTNGFNKVNKLKKYIGLCIKQIRETIAHHLLKYTGFTTKDILTKPRLDFFESTLFVASCSENLELDGMPRSDLEPYVLRSNTVDWQRTW